MRGFKSPSLPDVLIWSFSISFDGATLQLVLGPAGTLTRSVAVMSKFALAALLELLLSPETTVANTLCKAAEENQSRKRPVDLRVETVLLVCAACVTTEKRTLLIVTIKKKKTIKKRLQFHFIVISTNPTAAFRTG